ncbi:MAG: hypothetical protein A2Z99_18705 [Treponema sp. GWB1_62_6]|nr:MAG: hypothetical protein A2Y36_09420 [Treponema sp. GWA1_62_8]OHE64026.1 MAG: hypothetical protein A2001_14615 [Treponema sp. GWC1_61_84]OHE71788.1 MAG: hypothetical protein A2Z99_18705 [Treponema sp. GWB1_62_6]OHE72335.1 MAG: hypothetical protein A2413_00755 [Treponema sp. RIFOXYC1_FULL_61_9]HCM26360.1 hypothetical protein [Treponema sp.]
MSIETYYIRIKGEIDELWADFIAPLVITGIDRGETVLEGEFEDQARLHKSLEKLSSANIRVISVRELAEGEKQGGVE